MKMVPRRKIKAGRVPWIRREASLPQPSKPVLEQRELPQPLKQALEAIELPPEEQENLIGILERLTTSIKEVDYEQTVEWITGEERMDGPDSALGNKQPVNVIPGGHAGDCHPILIAFACGKQGRNLYALPNIMRKVKTHLIDCAGITRVCVLITHSWDARWFMKEHFSELRAHYRKGVRFLFLITGASAELNPIPVDFNRTS